jgi:DNA-binding beta-propeller fold protein YncE
VPSSGTAAIRILGANPDNAPRGPSTLLRPQGVAVQGGDLIVADTGNHRLLRFPNLSRSPAVPAADAVFGQAGFASFLPNGNRPAMPLASAQSLSSPMQTVFGPNQELFIADTGNNRVLAVPQAAGRYPQAARVLGQSGFTQTAPNLVEGRELSTSNVLATPLGSLLVSGGVVADTGSTPQHVYIADTGNNRVLGWRDARSLREGARAELVIGQPDLETTVANYGSSAVSGRPASASNLNHPSGLALDAAGNLYVADTGNNRVLRFPKPFEQSAQKADLVIGQPALSGNPVAGASAFLLNAPTGIAVHPARGDLLVADTLNNRVLYFPAPLATGMAATRVFGQNTFTSSDRGLSSAALSFPTGVAFDSGDNIYGSDTANNRIVVFGPLRDLPAAVAAALASGAAPIGQPDFVTSAPGTANNLLRNPTALWVDWTSGDLWVADTGNDRVLRFPPLAVLAINGGAAYASGGLFGQLSFTSRTANLGAALPGQASAAGLHQPNAVALDGMGNLLVGDGNARVLLYFPQAVFGERGDLSGGRAARAGHARGAVWQRLQPADRPSRPASAHHARRHAGLGE